jgi:hypothetical protein
MSKARASMKTVLQPLIPGTASRSAVLQFEVARFRGEDVTTNRYGVKTPLKSPGIKHLADIAVTVANAFILRLF